MLWKRGRAYAQDLRERVFAAFDAGLPVGQIAAMLMVSVSYVSKALTRRHDTGETEARPQRCHVPGKLAGLLSEIRNHVAARPDATIAEIRSWLQTRTCRFPASGSSWKSFAGDSVLAHDPGRRQGMATEQFAQAVPAEISVSPSA